jgi:glutamine phosphoribosylpyrophosphate amidotransferase
MFKISQSTLDYVNATFNSNIDSKKKNYYITKNTIVFTSDIYSISCVEKIIKDNSSKYNISFKGKIMNTDILNNNLFFRKSIFIEKVNGNVIINRKTKYNKITFSKLKDFKNVINNYATTYAYGYKYIQSMNGGEYCFKIK